MRRSIVALSLLAAVASGAPTWHVVDSDIATVDTGLGFTSDLIGYTGGAANGAGPEIFKTVNGGVNWTPCPAKFGLDLLLLDTDATENTIVVSSIFGELYSDDAGGSFTASSGGGMSQSVRYIGVNGDGGKKFGVTGTYGLAQTEGVGISVDGGVTFKTYDAALQTEARYGAFPTDTTWYVAAGEWPNEGTDDAPPTDDMPPTKASWKYTGRSLARNKPRTARKPAASPAPAGLYQAQITKTTDGGATFTTVFNQSNAFYFNGIDCQPSNADWCCACAESDSDSPVPGARVLCTQDGGTTWKQNFYAPATSTYGYSLMEIRFTTDTDVWAVGGQLNAIDTTAMFINSQDGGVTWTQQIMFPGEYAMGLSVVDPTHAFAAMINTLTQESGIAAYD